MKDASVVFDSCTGPIKVHIFSSDRMMCDAYQWLNEARYRKGMRVPKGVDDFTLVMGYQAQMLMVSTAVGRA